MFYLLYYVPSVLWHCRLGGRKSIQPVNTWVMGCWHDYLSEARCKDLHIVHLMPLPPHHLCFRKLRLVYPFGASLPRLSWKKAVKRLCLCLPTLLCHMLHNMNQFLGKCWKQNINLAGDDNRLIALILQYQYQVLYCMRRENQLLSADDKGQF